MTPWPARAPGAPEPTDAGDFSTLGRRRPPPGADCGRRSEIPRYAHSQRRQEAPPGRGGGVRPPRPADRADSTRFGPEPRPGEDEKLSGSSRSTSTARVAQAVGAAYGYVYRGRGAPSRAGRLSARPRKLRRLRSWTRASRRCARAGGAFYARRRGQGSSSTSGFSWTTTPPPPNAPPIRLSEN